LATGPVREEGGRASKLVDGALVVVSVATWLSWRFDRVSTQTAFLVVAAALLVAAVLFVVSKMRDEVDQPILFAPLALVTFYFFIEWVAFQGKGPMWLQVLAILAFLFTLFGDLGPSDASRSTPPDHPRTF
jgi:hypothetical protein